MSRIVTEKCVLRPLSAVDKPAFLRWRQDETLRDAALFYRFPVTQQMDEAWFERAIQDDKSRVYFVIADRESEDKALGYILISSIDWISRTALIGIVLGDAAARGKGIGSAALEAVVKVAFADMGLRKLSAEIVAYNEPSHGLFTAQGFHKEATLKAQVFAKGTAHDIDIYTLFNKS